MISICIPIYNTNVTKLVTDLHLQCEALDCNYEIILIDDASLSSFRDTNRVLSELNNVHYEELATNISRSAIRNLFPQKARYPYLIFIDNDAEVCNNDYILKYIRQRASGAICYGGTNYRTCSDTNQLLRWKFGMQRESTPINKRLQNPNKYFSTFNFMIDKRILLLHPFDENIQEYGYEDVLFHAEVIKEGYHITQIDNPLIHIGLISNHDFLQRTELAVKNLYYLQNDVGDRFNLSETIKLLRTKEKLDKYKLTNVVSVLFKLGKNSFSKNLLGKKPSLFIYDLYKLGYLCSVNISSK